MRRPSKTKKSPVSLLARPTIPAPNSESILEEVIEEKGRRIMEWVKVFNNGPHHREPNGCPVSGLLSRAFLTTEDYTRLVPMWIDKGYEVWQEESKLKNDKRREVFFSRLRSEAPRWK